MFELELKNPDELVIKTKDRTVNINVVQSTIDANLSVGTIRGAGEFEIGDVAIVGISLKAGGIMYRVSIEETKIGIVGASAVVEDLDELGPIDILGTNNPKFVSIVEPKVVIPMGNMDFAEVKGTIKTDRRQKVKNRSALPQVLEIWKLD